MGYWSMFLILLKCTPPYVVTMECWAGAPPCPRGPSLTQKSATTLAFHGTAITYKYSDPFLAPNSSLLTSVPYFPKSSGGWTTPCGHMGLAQPLLKKKTPDTLSPTSSLVLSKSAFHSYQCAFYNISLTTCGKVLLRDGPQHPAPESSTRSHCPSPLGEGSLKNRQSSRLIAYSVTPCSLAANVASSPRHSHLIFANVHFQWLQKALF